MSLLRTDPSAMRIRPDDSGIAEQIAIQDAAAATARALANATPNIQGTCQECQNPIGEKRLAALPTAKRCIACEEVREKTLKGGAPVRRKHPAYRLL